MLHTENRIAINAAPEIVYEIAANVVDWPRFLPHYRYVRVRWEGCNRREVAMSARRSAIPVRWAAIQELLPEQLQVIYHHIEGVTRGMDVVWRIERGIGATTVTIEHDLEPYTWWLRPRISRHIVGTLFVMHIADRTLRGVKRQAELAAAEAA